MLSFLIEFIKQLKKDKFAFCLDSAFSMKTAKSGERLYHNLFRRNARFFMSTTTSHHHLLFRLNYFLVIGTENQEDFFSS